MKQDYLPADRLEAAVERAVRRAKLGMRLEALGPGAEVRLGGYRLKVIAVALERADRALLLAERVDRRGVPAAALLKVTEEGIDFASGGPPVGWLEANGPKPNRKEEDR